MHDAQILPEFFGMITEYVCTSEDPSQFSTCLEKVYIPDRNEQALIVHHMQEIMHHMDVRHAEGAIMQLMIWGDAETLAQLLDALRAYNTSLETIRHIVSATMPLS